MPSNTGRNTMKPCPFCGCEEIPIVVWEERTLRTEEVRLYCPDCDAAGPPVDIEKRADDSVAEEAVSSAEALWDRRSYDEPRE